MNVLGLVFSLLLILSYGFFTSWEKQIGSQRLQKSYLGHQRANRKILNRYESETYYSLRQKPNPAEETKEKTSREDKSIPEPKEELNRECAQINLLHLAHEGREAHPLLYETAAKFLRQFYSPSLLERKQEYRFLDKLLSAIKSAENPAFLEKISFNDPDMQMIFYKMLKGTKERDLAAGTGYPSLLDYFKIESSDAKICLFHAHPDLLTVLFNSRAAEKLFQEIHKDKAPPLTKELIEKTCIETHLIALDPDLFSLIELGRSHHAQGHSRRVVEEDEQSHISLRKNIYMNPG